jgi:tetratricopeptide (TPR) repeat protein
MRDSLNALYRLLMKLPVLRAPLRRMVWYYGRDRKPSSSGADKLFLIMNSIWATFRPVGKIDPRYIAAKKIMANLAIQEVSADYDAAGIVPSGTFNLLADPDVNADLAQAERLLLETIEDLTDFAEGHYALGSLLLDRGNRQGALAQYLLAATGRAQILDNSAGSAINAEAYYQAGLLLAQAGLLKQAEYCQRRAIEADDSLPQAQLAYAQALIARGEFSRAAHHMRLRLSVRPP